jgi:hypothetical protein
VADDVTGIEPLITGPPAAELWENPIVSIRERRWLTSTRQEVERVTVIEHVRTATPAYRARVDDMCWDIEEWRDDTVTYNEQQTQQEYVDYTFECKWQDYLDWFNSNPGVKLTVPPDARLGPDGVLAIPRVPRETAIEQPFLQPGQAREGTRGWGRIDGTEVKDGQRVVKEGTPYLVETEHRPCGDQPPPQNRDASARAGSVLVYFVDMDTDELVQGGTVTAIAPNISVHDRPVDPPPDTRRGPGQRWYGSSFFLRTGDSITITHDPPPGYVVDHNSADQSPPNRVTVLITDSAKELTFYDRKIRARQAVPGAAPSTPSPPPQAPGTTPGTPPPAQPPEQQKPVEKPKEHAGRGLPAWTWVLAAALVVLIVASVVALVSVGDGGGSGGTATTTSHPPTSGSATPQEAPAALFTLPADAGTWLATGPFSGWTTSTPRTYTQASTRFPSVEAQSIAATLGWSRGVGYTVQSPTPPAAGPSQLFVDVDQFGSAKNAETAVRRIYANFSALGPGTLKSANVGHNQFFTYQLTARPVTFELGTLVYGAGVLSISAQLPNPGPATISATMHGIATVLDEARALAEPAR